MDRCMNRERMSGLAINATISDDARAIETVLGMNPINFPVTPVMRSMGRNAEIVVSVAEITGRATSDTPSTMAVNRSLPNW